MPRFQPKSDGMRFLADTREQVAQTTKTVMGRLSDAFRQRIAMLKRKF